MRVLQDAAREYRARAQHCVDIAAGLEGAQKVVLLEMARGWLKLADQARRNRKTDLVYEPRLGDADAIESQRPQPRSRVRPEAGLDDA